MCIRDRFRGGVTTAVETLRTGLEAGGHQAWVFAPGARETADPPFVFRYPAIPAPTYPGFAVPVPVSPRLARLARELRPDVIHVQHPFLLGVTGRRLARRLGSVSYTHLRAHETPEHLVCR